MLVLCINTGTLETNLCLVKDGEVIGESSWGDFAKEAEMLIPSLNKMLADAGVELADLEGIFVVSGPGSFSAIRVGVVTANTFAQNLGIPLYAVTTFEIMSMMYEGYDYITLNGGGTTLLVQAGESITSVKAEDFNESDGKLAADLTERQLALLGDNFSFVKKSLNFSEVCAKISGESRFEEYEITDLPLLPYYVKKPSIS